MDTNETDEIVCPFALQAPTPPKRKSTSKKTIAHVYTMYTMFPFNNPLRKTIQMQKLESPYNPFK